MHPNEDNLVRIEEEANYSLAAENKSRERKRQQKMEKK
jgi:hypothetical protein